MIRTVLGDIPAERLGACHAHEHLIIDRGYAAQAYPEFFLDSVEDACRELAFFTAAGGRAMVDAQPCGCGRNAVKLAQVSRRAGVHIVCPTGLHLEKYYPQGHWRERLDAGRLAALFIDDIERGVDANDYSGPRIERTRRRAGVIKAAGGLGRLNAQERKAFEAAALAHRATGAPILTHAEQGTAAAEQLELLRSLGVKPSHIVISHTDKKPDLAYHKDLAATGVFLEYDSAARWPPEQENPTRDLIVSLFREGLGGQIVLGMDAARRTFWRVHGGAPGLDYLLTGFRATLLDAGLTEADLQRLLVTNPARAFSFADDHDR